MPLEVHPMEESDLRAFTLIQVAAFLSAGGLATLVFPNPMTEEFLENMVKKSTKSFHSDPDCHWVKVIDTDLDNKIIACAKWRINERERTEEQMKNLIPSPSEEDQNNPAMVDFQAYLAWARKKYLGSKPSCRKCTKRGSFPHCPDSRIVLHVLVTHPDHHRRGAGAKLVRWGMERADKTGLLCYLEASPMGRPLYAHLGFEVVFEEKLDLTKYGLEGEERNTVMIRPPQAKQ